MRDLKTKIKVVNALDVTTIASDTTTNGEIIDRQFFDSLTFSFRSGTITDGDYTPLIQEGDESDLSDAASVADADLIGTEALAAFTADTDDNATRTIGYRGTKRYVRFNVVSTNFSASGGTVMANAILGSALNAPPAQAEAS